MSAFSYFNASLERDESDDDNDTDDPFLPSFTPRSHMYVLRKSFVLNLSTSYLVSKEPVNSSLNLIKPIHKKPYFTEEPDWSLIWKPIAGGPDQSSREEVLKRCQALEIALDHTKQQIHARDAVIEASCATVAILEL